MKIKLRWVHWPGRKPLDIRSLHMVVPGTDRTACGLDIHDGQGAQVVGDFLEDARPEQYQCCSLCVKDRKKIADQVRLSQWTRKSNQ